MEMKEIYLTVRTHLLTQKERSMWDVPKIDGESPFPPACAYRGKGGCKCAAGCLIPDREYSPAMEGGAVVLAKYPAHKTLMADTIGRWNHASNLVYDALESIGINTAEKLKLVRALQVVHDDSTPDVWEGELAKVAVLFGLDPVTGEGKEARAPVEPALAAV